MGEQTGGCIGGVFAVILIGSLFIGGAEVFMTVLTLGFFALVIWVIWAVLEAFGLFDHLESQHRKRKNFQVRQALKAENDLKEPDRIALREKILSEAEKYGVFNINTGEVIVTPIIDFLWDSFSVSLRSDYHKFNKFDGYGRKITDLKGPSWGEHIFGIVNSVEMDSKTKIQLDYVRQLCVFKHEFKAMPNLERGSYNTDGISSKTLYQSPSKVQREYIEYFTKAINTKIKSPHDLVFHEKMNGIEYEHFCADILRNDGWKVQVLPASNDHGADLIAQKNKITIAIQCKRYSKPYGNSAVQEVVAAVTHYGTHYGVVVSNQSGTSGARALAKSNGVPLINHDDLNDLEKIIS